MSSEASRLDGQKYPQLMKWVTVAGDWILPISLAVIMAGQILFSAARFYWGIEHPAWLFWGLLAAGVVLGILRAMPTFRASRADMAMLAFVFVLTVSFLAFGTGGLQRAIYFIAAFVLLPYLAGRQLDETGISRFIVAMSCIAFLAVPLIGFGLLSMPESELRVDRLGTLFAARDATNNAGECTTNASVALGLLLVLLTSILSLPVLIRSAALQFSIIAFMCCVVWLLIFVGLRGAILSALLVGGISLVAGYGSISRRMALLLILILAVVVSNLTMPSERRDHFGRSKTVLQQSIPTLWGAGQTQEGTSLPCVVYGDSTSTRLNLYKSAVSLFLDSPWLGIGAGNYGIKGYCRFDEAFMSPHSVLLQVLAELGLAGAIVFLSLVSLTLYGAFQIASRGTGQRQRLAWMLAAVWCYLFLLDQISGNYFTSYHFFAATGLIGSLVVTQRGNCLRRVDNRNQMCR